MRPQALDRVQLRRTNRRPVRVGPTDRWSLRPRQALPCPARLRARSPTLNVSQTGSVAHGRLASEWCGLAFTAGCLASEPRARQLLLNVLALGAVHDAYSR